MQGLQCFDSDGNITLDVTDRLTRVLGEFDTGTLDGTLTDDNLLDGSPWFYCYPSDANMGAFRIPCKIVFQGNKITWTFEGARRGQDTRFNTRVIYGVY